MLSTDSIFYLVVFLFLGAVCYNLDAAFGATVYGWWYSMTHKNKMPQGMRRGFIYERKAKTRFYTALVLAIGTYLIFSNWMPPGSLAKLITLIISIVAIFVGFYLGPALHVIWRKKDIVLDKIDDVESGRVDLAQEAKDTVAGLRDSVEGAVGGVANQITEAVTDAVEVIRDRMLPEGDAQPADAAAEQAPADAVPEVSSAEHLEQLMTEATGQAPVVSQPAEAAPAEQEEDPVAAARRKLKGFGNA